MNAQTYFEGKKWTVMGLGLLGRGLGDTKYIASQGAEVLVTDLKTDEQLATSVKELEVFSNISYTLGEHRLEDFRGRDFVLKAAGVPLDSVYIQEARDTGAEIKMSASLFAELAGIPITGVTGTRGKSTVTFMLEAIYKEAGKKYLLGGNVRGVSTLALLSGVTPEHTGLFELDSWQLQGFGEAEISPSISVFTNLYRDHMNYYHDDMETYLEDKAQIFLHQKLEDVVVLGTQVAELIQEKYGKRIRSRIVVAGEEDLPSDWSLQIPGAHNRYNAGLALATARAQGIPDEVSRKALETFPGAPGRLELVRALDGMRIYNDTNSTTPIATIMALRGVSEVVNERSETGETAGAEKRTILIMGGADKGLDMSELIAEIPKTVKRVILLAGSGTERIREELPEAEVFENLAIAFADARAHAESGDVILFSPAFASFGMFTNEYDRGDRFNALVNSIEA